MKPKGIADLQSSFRRRRETAKVLFDQSLLDEFRAIDARIEKAISLDSGGITDGADVITLQAELAGVQERIDEAEAEFTFEGLGRQRWTFLLGEHPPTDEQRDDGWEFHPDTFPPAAIAESCISRDLTVEDATWMMTELDSAEWGKLWTACIAANMGMAERPKSRVDIALRLATVRSSTTAPLEESLAASS